MTLSRITHQLSLLRKVLSPASDEADRGRALTYAIADRIQEVLIPSEFNLKTDGKIISVKGVGSRRGYSYSTAPSLLWNLPYPRSRRLELIFDIQSRELQRFLTAARHTPWPARDAMPHIKITSDAVHVWWGGFTEADALVRLRPIYIDELEV
jgi:hypothetical protein